MKRIISLVMAFTLCLGLSLAVFAAEPTQEVEMEVAAALLEGEKEECVVLTEAERAEFLQSMESEGLQEGEASPQIDIPEIYHPGANITQINGYPLLVEIPSGKLFYYSHIGVAQAFELAGQFMALRVTSDQAQNVYSQAVAYAYNNNADEGQTYAVIGWYIRANIKLSADKPKSVEYRVAEASSFDSTGAYETYSITSQSANYWIGGACHAPSGVNTDEYFYIEGLEGTFYYRNSKGTVLGIPFRASMKVNVTQ